MGEMMKTLVSSLLATYFLLCLSSITSAQNSQLTGLVKDKTDAVVPAAAVTLTNVETGAVLNAKSSKAGFYVFASIVPGRYSLAGDAPGFAKTVINDVKIDAAANVSQDIVLQVQSASQSVNVVSDPPAELTETTAAVSAVFDHSLIENAPLNGRSLDTLFELAPGTVLTPSSENSPGGYVINGQRASANNLTIDGASANIAAPANFAENIGGTGLPTSASGGVNGVLPVDAIEEYRIQTSTYSAEYGRTPGGQIQVKSRGGTNQYHGSVFEYFRNQVMDATDWFIEHDHQKQPPLRMNDFGGTFGGPIWKDKLFFFVAHETLLMHQPQFTSFDVPDAAIRQTAATVFQPFLAAFPTGNGGPDPIIPGGDIFNEPYSNVVATHTTSVRFDANLSHKMQLFERVNIAPSSFNQEFRPNGNISNSNYYTSTTGLTWTLSNKLLDELTVGFAKSLGNQIVYMADIGDSRVATTEAYVKTFLDTQKVQFGFNGPPSTGYFLGPNTQNAQDQWNLVDTLSWSVGRHTIKMGADYRRLTPLYDIPPSVSITTGQSDPQTFTNGIVESLSYATPSTKFTSFPFRYSNLSLYGQDTWRVTNRLTLDFGLRWDVNPAPSDGRGGPLTVTGNVQNPSSLQAAIPGTPLWQTRYRNLGPRLGFAYQLKNDPRFGTVVRGGAGTFYDTGTSSAAAGVFFEQYPYFARGFSSNIPFTTIDFNSLSSVPPSLPASNLALTDPHLQSPRTYEWSVTLDQAVGSRTGLSVSYIGNDGERLLARTISITSSANPLFTDQAYLYLETNGAHSNYQALQAQLKTRFRLGLQGYASYTWSHAEDTADSEFAFGNSLVPSQKTNAGFDIRHIFAGALHWETPGNNMNRFSRALTKGWAVDSVVRLQTADPLTVQTNDPVFNNLYQQEPQANQVSGVPVIISNSAAPGGKELNRAAFVNPPSGQQGDSKINFYRLFGLTQFDLSASRVLIKRESVQASFRVDAFNVFNIPNFSHVQTFLPSPNFGQAANTRAGVFGSSDPFAGGVNQVFSNGGPRNIQLSVKMKF